jgi:hypothetical protein
METQGSLYTLRGLLISLIFASANIQDAQAHPIVQSWQNRTGSSPGFSIAPKVTFFNTTHNYDLTSQSVLLTNAVQAQRYYIDLNMSYGFDENFFIFGRLSGLYTNVTGVGLSDQSAFGLNDQMAGAAYRVFQNNSGISINLQTEITLPAYVNANSVINSKPWMGDGSTDISFGGFAEIPLTTQPTYQIYLDGGAGFTFRSKAYASAIPWSLWLKRYPTQGGVNLGLGMRGQISMENDLSSASTAALDQNRGAGGSFLINAINPAWTLVQASIGYQTKTNINYALSGALPIIGKNSPDGIQISFGVQFDFVPDQSKKKSSTVVKQGAFKEYDLEAKVTSVNDQVYLVKIDQGTDQGVEKGQIFDIFNNNQLIAKAKVSNVKSDESALRVLEYYKEQSIEVDAIAKRIVQEP